MRILLGRFARKKSLSDDREAAEDGHERICDGGHRFNENVQRDAQWLARVTENLLSVTRFSSGEVALKKEDEVLEEIIGSAVLKYQQMPDALPVRADALDEILLVEADGVLLEQVLINLFDNVSAHAHGATQIWLHIDKTKDRIALSVEDDRPGIPAQVLALLPRRRARDRL